MKKYVYEVTGKGAVPVDMLRYDCAYPARGNDVSTLEESIAALFVPNTGRRKERTIQLVSHREPTKDRWASFQWYVQWVESR